MPLIRHFFRLALCALALGLGLMACKPAPPAPPVPPAPGFSRLAPEEAAEFARVLSTAWQGLGGYEDLAPTLMASLRYLTKRPPGETVLNKPGLTLTYAQLIATVEDLLAVLPALDSDPEVLAREFAWFAWRPEPLMTGYYAPEVEASLSPGPDYPCPLYSLPDDLLTLDLGAFHRRWQGQTLIYRLAEGRPVPYFDRRQIEQEGALAGRSLEIAWLKHPWDVEHLQVQGSGRLKLPDGRNCYALYAGKNGRDFVSVPRELLARGLLFPGEVHREGIRAALDRAGAEREAILAANPSYVFFRLSQTPPVGAMGQPLTGMVSLATDPALLPLGSVLALSAELPTTPDEPAALRAGLALPQDKGGVILGERIDFYCGIGTDQEYLAFRIKTPARVALLVSRRVLPE